MAAGTALTAASLASTGITTGLSFAQASKSKKLQKEAEAAAANSMKAARDKLTVNFYKGLGIQKEPYELEREALLSTGSQLIQAGEQSERGVAGVAGQVLQSQNQGQRNIAGAMGQELSNLNKVVASEDSRLRDIGTNLDLETAQGAQLAARNANMLANNSLEQGFQGVTSLLGQAASLAPLYSKTGSSAKQEMEAYNNAVSTGALDSAFMENGQPLPYEQAVQKYAGMGSSTPFLDYLTASQKKTGLKNYQFPIVDDNYGFY